MSSHAPSGLPAVPHIQWGSHLTRFFETGDELRDRLVPCFRAGLENNEHCLWVTDTAFTAAQARHALRALRGECGKTGLDFAPGGPICRMEVALRPA